MGRLSVAGKYIYQDRQKFFACGVSYGPFAPNSRDEPYPEPERAAADFAMMSDLGANLVRTYVMPPSWMFELAAKHGLWLMPGISWPQHLTFLDSPEMVRDIRDTFRREMAVLRQFKETIFAYSIGNEIRSDIVRWHGPRIVSRFLAELYEIGKQFDPEGLFTYSNYPSAEYLDLSFLDLISFNVYLHREPDFRRYLTHLMAITGECPLLLSETGIDTIREGEQHQADLLSWQSRAAFELGLSGLVIFAFTDEWFRGGGEIMDWAFGLTTRERAPKPSFANVSRIFRGPLPPPLTAAPTASVIVAAYNAASTLARCIESLKRLRYPTPEIIIVDDGSTDSTAAIAESAGVRTLRLPHRGLAAARNGGLTEARGRIVAFVDADAEADCDWLYHLAEAIHRRNAAAAGGQTLAPKPGSPLAAVIAAAPGQAQEVRSGDQDLAQLCGCNMAVDKAGLDSGQLFDPAFTGAGDDVDFSWRLRDLKMTLAYAPGAIVLHQPRTTIGAYLQQQRGYGHAEGLLFRKYPQRQDQVYGDSSWFGRWFGGSLIYYGEFGRGLFQTVYPRSGLPLALHLPLTFQWIAVAVVLALAGVFDRMFGFLGAAGIVITLACAAAGAARSGARLDSFANRLILAALWVLGPLVRSWERELVKWTFAPDESGESAAIPPKLSGTLPLMGVRSEATQTAQGEQNKLEQITEILRLALVRRGLAVAKGTSYDSFDLQIIVPPLVRVSVLVMQTRNVVSLGWRTGLDAWRTAGCLGVLFIVLLWGGFSLAGALSTLVVVAGAVAAIAIRRAYRVPAVIGAASTELVLPNETASPIDQQPSLAAGPIEGTAGR